MLRLVGGGLGVWMALLLEAGCGGPPAVPVLSAPAPLVTGGSAGPGLRVDLTGTAHHVRGLQKQPDGTYRSVCTDSPEALHPATRSGLPR